MAKTLQLLCQSFTFRFVFEIFIKTSAYSQLLEVKQLQKLKRAVCEGATAELGNVFLCPR